MDEKAAAKAHKQAEQLLRERRFAEAWPLFEGRRWMSGTHTRAPLADYPEWMGEDLSGKSIMVVAEQGFGDQFMFGRYLPLLAARAAKVEILCHPTIWPVFGQAGYSGHPFFVNRPAPTADFWVLMGSLPLRLGVNDPPPPVWLPRAGSGSGVGVRTAGSPTHFNDKNRSLPYRQACDLRALGTDLDPAETGAKSFLDTAQIIDALELVVSVDTSVVHLAGAMGRQFWVLLPKANTDWRWADGVSSPWYPDAKLYPQPRLGDWRSVLKAVSRDLAR